jgi:hydroxymethylbilane synthase
LPVLPANMPDRPTSPETPLPAPIRIGTRGSPLALYQAHHVRDRLAEAHGLAPERFEIVVIKTSGDRIQDRPLAEVGGKGLFTKELEEALNARDIDLAVHSMKDMATALPDGLVIGAVLEREDARDAFVSVKYPRLAALAQGAVVGTSSLRRAAQLRHMRPDVRVVEFRGNVETRINKLEAGIADATFLACAGLKRLGKAARITEAVPTEVMLPAVAQGAIAIEVRGDDVATNRLVAALDDRDTAAAVAAERVFLARLEGSCRTPIAGHAEVRNGALRLRGEILKPDGSIRHAGERNGQVVMASDLALSLADELLAAAGPGFLDTARKPA